MSTRPESSSAEPPSELKRAITGRLLFFYVLGDVLGSGIYVLVGAVAGAVGGAFWSAFAVGVIIATMAGLAYAELATKYPQAAGASLYVERAFGNRALTFLVTIAMLSAALAASGALATGFGAYFAEIWEGPPLLLVSIALVLILSLINFLGITESVLTNVVMTVVEVVGLVMIVVIAVVHVSRGDADVGVLADFNAQDGVLLAIVSGVAFSFFAMTGFENAVNVAEEVIEPEKAYPRALIGGMLTAGVIYVLVSIAAASSWTSTPSPARTRRCSRSSRPTWSSPRLGHDLLGHRDGRDHQHDARHDGHAVPDPLRDGQGGRRTPGLQPGAPAAADARGGHQLHAPPWCAGCCWPGGRSTRPASASTSSPGSRP